MEFFILTYPNFDDEVLSGSSQWNLWVNDDCILEKKNTHDIFKLITDSNKKDCLSSTCDECVSYVKISKAILETIPCLLRFCMKTSINYDEGDGSPIPVYNPIDLDTMYATAGRAMGPYIGYNNTVSFSQGAEYSQSSELDRQQALEMDKVFEKAEENNSKHEEKCTELTIANDIDEKPMAKDESQSHTTSRTEYSKREVNEDRKEEYSYSNKNRFRLKKRRTI